MSAQPKQDQYNDHVTVLYRAADAYLAQHPETRDICQLQGLSEAETRAAVMIELMKRQASTAGTADEEQQLRALQLSTAVGRAQDVGDTDQEQALEDLEALFEDISDLELPLPSPATMNRAVWSTAYQNDLPDSSFAYIEPGGTKDKEGKTTPRSKRHLPYKDKDGKVDAAHVKNALQRLPQTHISAEAKKSALRKLSAAARRIGVKVGPNKAA